MGTFDAGSDDRGQGRLHSLDAYRGFVMLLMATGGLGLGKVAQSYPDSSLWQALDHQFEHVAWRGCSLWDLIQPGFMFIVGVAMPYSYANRRAQGQSWSRLFAHAVARSLILIALAVLLSSAGSRRTNYIFTNVLAQIGLGYTFVFLLLGRPAWVQATAASAILVGDWFLFELYDVAAHNPGLELSRVPDRLLHWEKHINVAAAFDHWFLNLFPRPDGTPYTYNEGGYTTLNFIPSIVTMLFGVMAGQWLRSARSSIQKLQGLAVAGALGIALGTVLDGTLCPVVKRLWTPSWVVFSTGWTCVMLAGFYGAIDVLGFRRWSFPLAVVGVNSIAMYVMAQLLKPWVARQLQVHLGRHVFDFQVDGVRYAPIVQSVAVTSVLWLICLWLYRRKIFVKI